MYNLFIKAIPFSIALCEMIYVLTYDRIKILRFYKNNLYQNFTILCLN